MTTRASRRESSALFFDPKQDIRSSVNGRSGNPASPQRKVAHGSRTRKSFLDGIVNGERVLIAKPAKPREKSVEIQIRVALATEGVMVMKHHVDNRAARTGLGLGVADLICVVPPYGRFLGIEVKRPGQKPRTAQRRWLDVVRRFGGVTGVATSVEEAMRLVEEAQRLP
jgi:hypothetical protein